MKLSTRELRAFRERMTDMAQTSTDALQVALANYWLKRIKRLGRYALKGEGYGISDIPSV